MKMRSIVVSATAALCIVFLSQCNESNSSGKTVSNDSSALKYGGFASQIEYGHHLVQIAGCNDCHTPKKMTATGPAPDMTLLLSGHPAAAPVPDVDHAAMESKGLAVTNDMTAWVGPWGTSYAANLTPDETGIGHWTETQFIRALREGKFKGLPDSRPLLPPMPWQNYASMKDEELKAIFAYLQSVKPVHNIVPPPVPPATMHH